MPRCGICTRLGVQYVGHDRIAAESGDGIQENPDKTPIHAHGLPANFAGKRQEIRRCWHLTTFVVEPTRDQGDRCGLMAHAARTDCHGKGMRHISFEPKRRAQKYHGIRQQGGTQF